MADRFRLNDFISVFRHFIYLIISMFRSCRQLWSYEFASCPLLCYNDDKFSLIILSRYGVQEINAMRKCVPCAQCSPTASDESTEQ